jgi:RimJ/RimL family protein N-acetyltransferase
MPPGPITTDRLTLTPLAAGDLAAFHALTTDPHVRRYLMDGEVLPVAWASEQIAASSARFERGALGLWLARPIGAETPIGFCGFLALPGTGLDNEQVYALAEAHTGRGLATEMARAMIARAPRQAGPISASVDAVNTASVRILEKLGFLQVDTRPGAFGPMLIFVLEV